MLNFLNKIATEDHISKDFQIATVIIHETGMKKHFKLSISFSEAGCKIQVKMIFDRVDSVP